MTDPGEDPARATREALERLLLDGPRKYTRLQVAEMAGIPPHRTQRLWRALGFPDAGDQAAFTDADLAALSTLTGAVESGAIDFDTAVRGPRVRDLAYLAYRVVPLAAPGNPDAPATPEPERARRAAARRRPGAATARWLAGRGFAEEAVEAAAAGRDVILARPFTVHRFTRHLPAQANVSETRTRFLETDLQYLRQT